MHTCDTEFKVLAIIISYILILASCNMSNNCDWPDMYTLKLIPWACGSRALGIYTCIIRQITSAHMHVTTSSYVLSYTNFQPFMII